MPVAQAPAPQVKHQILKQILGEHRLTLVRDFYSLPDNLPIPQDDQACAHLEGCLVPSVELQTTLGNFVNLSKLTQEPTVLFFYPRTGRPDEAALMGWDEIPGARGCTPQSCGFRNLHTDFKHLGVNIYGISSQSSGYQSEFVRRTEMPFPFLSDEQFCLTNSIRLPTFEFNSMRLIKRLAIFIYQGVIVKKFYPVFPPDKNAETVLDWLRHNQEIVFHDEKL